MRYETRSLRMLVSIVCLAAISSGALAQGASGQTAPSGATQLKPYTTPDKSASAGVPPGWKVTTGAQTDIVMTGPHGETIFLGRTIVARNAAFNAGQRPSGGVDLSMPYSTPLAQKLTTIVQAGATAGGAQAPQISITSATSIPLLPALGQCGRFIAKAAGGAKGSMTIASVMCSLPVDSGGLYKNVFKLATAPTGIAAQEASLAQAVFSSYRVPAPMLARKLAPVTPVPVAHGAAPPAERPGMLTVPADPTNSDCYDLVLIRETPTYQLPRHCGGTAPD